MKFFLIRKCRCYNQLWKINKKVEKIFVILFVIFKITINFAVCL